MNTAFLSDGPSGAIHECRCCDLFNRGLNDGSFGHDPKGPWRRIGNIDGRNAICPTCQADPEALDHLVHDGYEHACRHSRRTVTCPSTSTT